MKKGNSQSKTEDLTGQNRFAWNLFVGWISQLVMIFSGFVMPRLVDDNVGQVSLGIWDFGWSFVSYLSLIGLGMGACFNRYVSKYRSVGDFLELNKVANSAVFVQAIFATTAVLSTVAFYFVLPIYFSDTLMEHTETAQWVVLYLGLSVAVRMISGSASGLLTGYHRWDIHNALHAGDSILSVILMVIALYFTQMSVAGMALGYLVSTIVFEFLRFVFMNKVCKEFKFNLRLANRITCKEMFVFGIKSMLSNIPPIILLQTISIMLVSTIGPAALAIFARPMALTKQVKTFMTKFTLMLTPTTGSMQGAGDLKAIQTLFLNTTALSFAFTFPSLGFLFIYGDVILHYWMGSEYALTSLVMILALGQLLPMGQDTSIRILMGMNQHGRISLVAFIAIFISFSIGLLFTGVEHWELTTAALLFVIPMNLVYGLLVPIYTCRELKLSWFLYLNKAFIKPFIYVLPFFALIAWSRFAFENNEITTAFIALLCGSLITVFIYFLYLVPKHLQNKVYGRLRFYS